MNELETVVAAYRRIDPAGLVLATVVSVDGSAYRRPGAHMLIDPSGETVGGISAGCLEADVIENAGPLFGTGKSLLLEYDSRSDDDLAWGLGSGCNGLVKILLEGLAAGSWGRQSLEFASTCLDRRESGVAVTDIHPDRLGVRSFWSATSPVPPAVSEVFAQRRSLNQGELFYDLFAPPPQLYIYGGEMDTQPLVSLAKRIGWRVVVVDLRARELSRRRFAEADQIVLQRLEHFELPPDDAYVVLMTHRFEDDLELLRRLRLHPGPYIGLLGQARRTAKVVAALEGPAPAQLHSPVGLPIGGETPVQIALSIVAQLQQLESGYAHARSRAFPEHLMAEAK